MTEQYPDLNPSDASEPHYSGPYEHDPRDPVAVGEVLEVISDMIETAAQENAQVADARNGLRNLLDPMVRGGREVSDEELGDALQELGRALRGDKDEGTARPE